MTYAGYNWQGKGKWKGINAYPVTPLTPELKVDYEFISKCASVSPTERR